MLHDSPNGSQWYETYMIDCFKWKDVVIGFIKTLAGSYIKSCNANVKLADYSV